MQFNPPQLGCSFNQNQNFFNPQSFQVPALVQNKSLNVTESIVGEGDLFPIQQFDGTLQLYFVPRHFYSQNPRPCLCNRQPCYCNSWPYPGQVQAWFVRSIANCASPPIPVFLNYWQTQDQRNNFWRNQQNQGIQFHRDGVTSTTDLCLFYPALRAESWVAKPCACVQVTPVNVTQPNTCCCNNHITIEEKTRASNANKSEPKKNDNCTVEPNELMSTSSLSEDSVNRPGCSGFDDSTIRGNTSLYINSSDSD